MAYITMQLELPNVSVATLNEMLELGQENTIVNVRNLMDAVNSGTVQASGAIVTSTVAGTVSGQTGGATETITKL